MLWVFGFLVTARVTRFITSDFLAAPVRVTVIDRFGPDSKLSYLVECPWCLSLWVGLAPAAVVVAAGSWPYPGWLVFLAAWLGWSYLYGLLAAHLDS